MIKLNYNRLTQQRLMPSFFLLLSIMSISFTGCLDDPVKPSSEVELEADAELNTVDQDFIPDQMMDAELDMDIDMEMLSCAADGDCETGRCVEGACVQECSSPTDCPGRFDDCRSGRCYNRCFGAGTCFNGGVCLNGICVDEQCEEDSDCEDGRLCRGQLCVRPDPCSSDDECSSRQRCIEGNCEALSVCGGDANCADDEICVNGRCSPVAQCEENGDCTEGEDCVAGRCVPGLCRGEVDCELGQICEAGECIDPPMISVDRVVILNTARSLLVGQNLELRAVALDSNGQIVASSGFTWQVAPELTGEIDATNLFTAGPEAGEASITAQWQDPDTGMIVSSLPLILPVLEPLPPVEAGWRVRVADGASGRPLAGADVYVDGDVYTTDSEGIATFDNQADRLSFTVMSPNHDTVSVVGISQRSLYLPLQPLSDDSRIAGFTGELDFSDVRNNGQVELGLAGGAFADGLSQITFFDLLGQLFFTEVDAGPINATIPLPGGLVAQANVPFLGDFAIKDEYAVITTEGFQLGWSFGGRIAIQTVLGLLQDGNISVGRVLGVLLPFFDQFEHGIQAIPELVGYDPVADVNDQDRDGDRRELVPDYAQFPEINLRPSQAQNLRLAVDLPEVFDTEGDPIALLLAGVDIVDVGFVPLGLTATQEGGLIPMRMAPAYQGLQVGDYVVLALSARFNNRIPRDISGLMQRFSRIPEQVNLADSFMTPPEYSLWEPAFRRLTPEIPDEADLLRVSFRGGVGRWVVYFGQEAADTVRLPFPIDPNTPDLTVGLDVRFDAIDLEPGVTLNELVGEGGIGDILQLDQFTQRFSRRVDNGR